MLSNLTITQLMMLIILIRVLLIPVDAFLFAWITNLWYSKKTEYTVDTMKRIVNVIEEMKKIWDEREETEGDSSDESSTSESK